MVVQAVWAAAGALEAQQHMEVSPTGADVAPQRVMTRGCIASHVVHVSVPSPTHEAREADGHDRCTSTLSGRHVTV